MTKRRRARWPTEATEAPRENELAAVLELVTHHLADRKPGANLRRRARNRLTEQHDAVSEALRPWNGGRVGGQIHLRAISAQHAHDVRHVLICALEDVHPSRQRDAGERHCPTEREVGCIWHVRPGVK